MNQTIYRSREEEAPSSCDPASPTTSTQRSRPTTFLDVYVTALCMSEEANVLDVADKDSDLIIRATLGQVLAVSQNFSLAKQKIELDTLFSFPTLDRKEFSRHDHVLFELVDVGKRALLGSIEVPVFELLGMPVSTLALSPSSAYLIVRTVKTTKPSTRDTGTYDTCVFSCASSNLDHEIQSQNFRLRVWSSRGATASDGGVVELRNPLFPIDPHHQQQISANPPQDKYCANVPLRRRSSPLAQGILVDGRLATPPSVYTQASMALNPELRHVGISVHDESGSLEQAVSEIDMWELLELWNNRDSNYVTKEISVFSQKQGTLTRRGTVTFRVSFYNKENLRAALYQFLQELNAMETRLNMAKQWTEESVRIMNPAAVEHQFSSQRLNNEMSIISTFNSDAVDYGKRLAVFKERVRRQIVEVESANVHPGAVTARLRDFHTLSRDDFAHEEKTIILGAAIAIIGLCVDYAATECKEDSSIAEEQLDNASVLMNRLNLQYQNNKRLIQLGRSGDKLRTTLSAAQARTHKILDTIPQPPDTERSQEGDVFYTTEHMNGIFTDINELRQTFKTLKAQVQQLTVAIQQWQASMEGECMRGEGSSKSLHLHDGKYIVLPGIAVPTTSSPSPTTASTYHGSVLFENHEPITRQAVCCCF